MPITRLGIKGEKSRQKQAFLPLFSPPNSCCVNVVSARLFTTKRHPSPTPLKNAGLLTCTMSRQISGSRGKCGFWLREHVFDFFFPPRGAACMCCPTTFARGRKRPLFPQEKVGRRIASQARVVHVRCRFLCLRMAISCKEVSLTLTYK